MDTRAKELDRKFDVGEDITRHLDLSKPGVPVTSSDGSTSTSPTV